MKLLSMALFLSILSFLSSCDQKHIKAKRLGLIPVREQAVGHFRLETIDRLDTKHAID